MQSKKRSSVVHSAMLEISGDERAVRHRLWSAQAAVLLPLVEERRAELVKEHRHRIRLPVKTEDGEISDPLDLSIGQLAWLLDRQGEAMKLRKQLRRLKRVRNALAHMAPVRVEDALHEALVGG